MLSDEAKRNAIDYTKAFLIILIVLGHNRQLMKIAPDFRWFLYNWHVYSFFLITAIVPFRATDKNFIVDRLFRYYVPFLVFFTASWLMSGGWGQPAEKLLRWGLAAAIGSAELLDRASGARLFWFLPALLGLTLLRWGLARTGPAYKFALPLVALGGFLLSGLIPAGIKPYLPLGLPIALYVLAPCLAFACFVDLAAGGGSRRLLGCGILAVIAFAICTSIAAANDSSLVLASFEYFDVRSPVLLLTHALLAVSACAALIVLGAYAPRVPWLLWIGKASLLIYLSHQMIYVLGSRAVGKAAPALAAQHPVATGLLLLAATLCASVLFARCVLLWHWLRTVICPRTMDEWWAAVRVRKHAAGA